MNLLELIFTVCAIGNADLCEDKRIAVAQEPSVMSCLMQAQPTMAQWVAENPNWRIVRWHCDYSANRKQKVELLQIPAKRIAESQSKFLQPKLSQTKLSQPSSSQPSSSQPSSSQPKTLQRFA